MKSIFYYFRFKFIIFTFLTRVRDICSKFSSRIHKISSKNDIFMLFSPNPIEKPSRLTPVGTRISLLGLQNHRFSLFSYVYDVFASKWHHKFMIWCPTIPFWTPKWSQTSSARSAGRPSGLAEPGWPGLASPAARSRLPAGGLLCRGGGEEGRAKEGGSAQENPAPPLLSPQVGYFVDV